MERIPVTPEGYEAIRRELENLKRVIRPENIRAIEAARAHGDLSENAEYAAAKDRQGFIEGRISELEHKLAHLEVIRPEDVVARDRVAFGCRVRLENLETGQVVEYRLVGPDESDVERGRLSVTSPIGRALLGKKPGDEVTVDVPGGRRRYELVEIL